jgi:hypothetical protein
LSVVRRAEVDVADDIIRRLPSMRGAIKLCAELAPVDDKVICLELKIDAGQWSRIKSGQAHFPDEKLTMLMDVCGNEVPLRWLALNRGYGLVRLKSALEAELESARQEIANLNVKLEHFEEFQSMKGRR